jgi:hypothetical protein
MSVNTRTNAFLGGDHPYVESPCFPCLGFLESDDVGYGGYVSRIANMEDYHG